jgi:hypothetical protein
MASSHQAQSGWPESSHAHAMAPPTISITTHLGRGYVRRLLAYRLSQTRQCEPNCLVGQHAFVRLPCNRHSSVTHIMGMA